MELTTEHKNLATAHETPPAAHRTLPTAHQAPPTAHQALPTVHQEPPTAQAAEDTPASCPMAAFLEMLTRPWTLQILWSLSTNGPMRFGALRRTIEGISARLLTVRLRTLEAEGFVRRTVTPGRITEVTYSPTSRLRDMNQVMANLSQLHQNWQSTPPTQ